MPRIPIIASSNPLPNLPGPVLDRNQRPTVDNRGVMAAAGAVAAASRNPQAPMSLAEPYGALASIGRAVAETGSIVGALALKQRQAETDVQIADADNTMTAAQGDFEAWKMEHPDPMHWGAEWEKRLTAVGQRIDGNDSLHPAAREQIGLRLKRFAGVSYANVQRDAAKESFARARSSFVASLDRYTEAQDQQPFEQTLKTGEEHGYLYPHEAENARQTFKRVGEQKAAEAKRTERETSQNNFAAAMDADPWEAESLLSGPAGSTDALLPGIDDSDKLRMKAQVREAQHARQSASREAIRDDIVSGAADDAEIERRAKEAKMGAEDIAQLKDFRKRVAQSQAEAGPIDWTKAGQIAKDIQEFDPDSGNPEDTVKQWGTLMERVEMDAVGSDEVGRQTQSALRQRLWQKHPYHERRKPDPDLGDIGGEFDDILDVHEQAGAFGPAEEKVTVDGFQKTRVPAETAKQSATMRRVLKMELKREAAADPDRFNQPGAVDEWISKRLRRERVSSAAGGIFNPILPGPNDIKLQDILKK